MYGIFLFMSRVFLSFSRFLPYFPSSLFSCMLPPFFLYLHLEGVLPTAFRVFSFVTVCYTILSTAFLSFFRTPDFVHRLAVIYASLRLFLRLVGPLCGVFRLFCMLPAFFFISQPTRRLVYCIRSVLRPSPFLIIFFTVFLCFSKLMTILFCLSSLMFDLQPNYSTRHHLRTAYFDRGWGSIFSVGKPVPVV